MNNYPTPSSHDVPVDPDLALLESYLDGDLSTAERQSLQQRLAGDVELSAALSRLSEEFAVRQAVWTSLEGTNAQSDLLARQIMKSVRRAGMWERSRNYLRAGAAVAACLVCFVAGWVGRGTAATAGVQPGVNSAAVAKATPLLYQVALTDEEGNITAVQTFDNPEDAQSFASDVGKWQAEQALLSSGQPVLTQSGL